jgi:hypothetical protein
MKHLYQLTDAQQAAAVAAIDAMIASYDPIGDSAGVSMVALEHARAALCKPIKKEQAKK